MPANRNALLRYQVIDKCLQNRGRKWTWQEIVNKVNEALLEQNPKSKGIGKTTFYEDLKDLEGRIYSMEIERTKIGKTQYLRYANVEDSINNQPLGPKEAEQLKNAVMALSRFRGAPQFEFISEIVPILESKIGLINTGKEIMSFDSNIDYSGNQYIALLFDAIMNKRALKIIYQDFKNPTEYDLEVHPQYLKQHNSRWFVMSINDKWADKPQIQALDRIKKIQELDIKYKELKNYDWENYFSDMIGVTRFDSPSIEIKILILDSEQASYIDTKPLHQSQKKLKKVDLGYETSINVIPNYELEKLILSFGARIKIVSPPSFKEKIAKQTFEMSNLYQKE